MDSDHVPREQFLIEFFGMFARELGNPPFEGRKRYFTDNPNDIFGCINFAKENKLPAFISVNPFVEYGKVLGIEKLFFDFDFGKKKEIEKLSEVKIEERKKKLQKEVSYFLRKIEGFHIIPMVIKTRRGFHIHIYLDKVYSVKGNDDELLKETYHQLQFTFIKSKKGGYTFMDTSVLGDHKRLCRIPTSVHQETGEECYLIKRVDNDSIEKDKLHGIDFYRQNGLKEEDWIDAVRRAIDKMTKDKADFLKKEQERELYYKDNWEIAHGFVGSLRYCFQKAIDSGEANHQLRLALLLEVYWSGHKTPESIIDLFRKFHDFDETKTKEQVEWFFKNKVPEIEQSKKWKPYRCSTLQDLNICIQSSCPIYQQRKENEKSKNV